MRGDPPERILTHPSSFPSAFLVCALRWLPSGVGSTRRADPARRAARSRHLRHAAAGQTPAHLDEEHPAPRAFRQPEHRRARPAERSSEYFSGIWRNARLIYPPVSCRRLPSQTQEKTTESAPDSFPPRTRSAPLCWITAPTTFPARCTLPHRRSCVVFLVGIGRCFAEVFVWVNANALYLLR